MFLRHTKRKKDGKEHRYWSIVEEARKAERGNAAAEGTRCADAGHAGPADIADRSRCPFNGHKRPRLRGCGLQRAGRRRHQASSDRHDRGDKCRQRPVATRRRGQADQRHAAEGEPRCRRRSRLLQQHGDPGVRGSRHYSHFAKADGRFGKQDFRYMAGEDLYICPAGERLTYRYTNEEHGLVLRRYWTNACPSCAIKHSCTPSKERRITRWEHEHVLEAVQRRLDEHPEKMRQRRETVEHPFGTIKARMGATHFLMKTLPRVATEMALHVLTYNLTRVINIIGPGPLIAAIKT